MKIPDHLSEAAQKWVARVASEYVLAQQDLLILFAAGESWDRAREAREAVTRDGLTFVDRHGSVRPHPCCAVEREHRTLFARLLRDLNLPTISDPAEANDE